MGSRHRPTAHRRDTMRHATAVSRSEPPDRTRAPAAMVVRRSRLCGRGIVRSRDSEGHHGASCVHRARRPGVDRAPMVSSHGGTRPFARGGRRGEWPSGWSRVPRPSQARRSLRTRLLAGSERQGAGTRLSCHRPGQPMGSGDNGRVPALCPCRPRQRGVACRPRGERIQARGRVAISPSIPRRRSRCRFAVHARGRPRRTPLTSRH